MKRTGRYVLVGLFSILSIVFLNKLTVNASDGIIRGADIGWLSQLENEGG